LNLKFTRVNLINRAGVAELVDAQDLKSCALRGVRVRFPPSVPLLTPLITTICGLAIVMSNPTTYTLLLAR
jgi:hypothetical protein